MAHEFVGGKAQGLALALGDLDRHDFRVEAPGLLCRFRLVLRSGRECVLGFARNAVFACHVFRGDAHVVLVIHVPQTIDDHGVDQLGVTHAETVA